VIGKIVSGGQTGVDRAALDAALALGFPCGGWCPAGRIAEDGAIDQRYPLVETPGSEYGQRTEWNVRDADGTFIICRGELDGGTLYTRECARRLAKPYMVLDPDSPVCIDEVLSWICENSVRVLNVAGPRESKSPGIYLYARAIVEELIGALTSPPP